MAQWTSEEGFIVRFKTNAGHTVALIGLIAAVCALPALAQEGDPEPGETAQMPVGAGFGGPLSQRLKLTGNWGGYRDELALKGLTIDLDVTHITQWLADGGLDEALNSRLFDDDDAIPPRLPN